MIFESIDEENSELKRETVSENFKGEISRNFWLILKNVVFSEIESIQSDLKLKVQKSDNYIVP